MGSPISLPKHLARVVLAMEFVCYENGQGPDSNELVEWIRANYPELADECAEFRIVFDQLDSKELTN